MKTNARNYGGLLALFASFLPITVARPAIDNPTASAPMQFRVQRGFIPKDLAESLFQDILQEAVPGPNDDFHEKLVGVHGDAGAPVGLDAVDGTTQAALATRFQGILAERSQTSDTLESGILRIEYLRTDDKESVDQLINAVVENSVMEEGGTIHMYLSKPNAAALDNHTDVTDIFVLHLHGSKEWLICPNRENRSPSNAFMEEKIGKCSTYDAKEMDGMECESHILYPGDALYLPRRAIHSARATPTELAGHLTFGFNGNSDLGRCEMNDDSVIWTNKRSLQGTCTKAEGGSSCNLLCNLSCDGSCNSGCNSLCNCLCDSSSGTSSCDGCCNGSCDLGCNTLCNSGCNSGCDICPSSPVVSPGSAPQTPSPRPPPPTPCKLIDIQEACGDLATQALEGLYRQVGEPYPCQNDNVVKDLFYVRPWKNETSNGTYVLYLGETAPLFTNISNPRWMITYGETFCSNSPRRMAVFSASQFSPHLLFDDSKIACSDRDIRTGPSGALVQHDLKIVCLDTAAPTLPTTAPFPPSITPPRPPKTSAVSAAAHFFSSLAASFGALFPLLLGALI